MKKLTASIFTVLLATVGAANADIASRAYVEGQIGTLGSLETNAKGNVVAAINELKSGLGAATGAEGLQSKQDKLTSGENGNISTSGNGKFVTSVTATDGAVTVGLGAIEANDVPELAISKITGLQAALDGKQGTMTIDSALSDSSENPVQNKVINTALGTKQDTITTTAKLGADLVDDSTSANKFVTAAEKAQITTNQGDITILKGADTVEGSVAKTVKDAIAANNTTNAATTVTHTANTAAGSATNPVYIAADGTATAITSYPATNVTEDTTHRFVTDAEKTAWGAKQDAIGAATGSDGTYVLTANVADGVVSGYKWELITRAAAAQQEP